MFTVIENIVCKLQSCAKLMGCCSKIRTQNLKKKNPHKIPKKNPNNPRQYFCATILMQLLSKTSLFSHHGEVDQCQIN